MRTRVFLIFAISLTIFAAAPWIGMQTIAPADISGSGIEARIFWQLRLPRVLMAWCAGATFGLCGMVFQALFRNPLAEPSLLGVSSGAALGAAFAIRFMPYLSFLAYFGSVPIIIFAFIGAMIAVTIITSFATVTRGARDATLLLAGIAIGALCSSLIMVFQYTGGADESYKLLSWTMGGINAVGIGEGLRALPSLAIALGLSARYATELDLFTFGDTIAATRGVNIEHTRRLLFAGQSMAIAIVVANCGPIAFLGLIAPHVSRRIVGFRHRLLAPVTALVGGSALVICDTAARTLWAPSDLPVGIIISFLGGPFFLWLLIEAGKKRIG